MKVWGKLIIQHNPRSKFSSSFYAFDKIANLVLSIQKERIQFHVKMKQKNDLSSKEKIIPKEKPFVLCVFDSIMKRYFVLGTQPKSNRGIKNDFEMKFKEAAQNTRSRFSCDSFENSLVEVHKDDFGKFLESLIDS